MGRRNTPSAHNLGCRSMPVPLIGSCLVYEDKDTGIYRLSFTTNHVDWECIAGACVGETGSAPYHAAQVDRDTLLIAWCQPSGETTTMVVDSNNHVALICHAYGGECEIASSKILEWTEQPSAARGSYAMAKKAAKRRDALPTVAAND